MTRDEIKYEALKELGYTEEPDFEADDDNAVNALNGSYTRIYHLALQSFDWSFAIQREHVEYQQQSTGRYKYVYELPDDLLYLRNVYADDKYTLPLKRYERNGRLLYTNAPDIYIDYTKAVCEDTLPAYFVDYLIYKLARKCCTKITGDNNLLSEMVQNEQLAFNEAKNADIKQQEVRVLPTGTFTDVRF